MANAFTLFGELKADTRSFEQALHRSETRLAQTGKAIADTERKAEKLGQTSATSARKYEKLNEAVNTSRTRLRAAADAFQRGDISARKFGTEVERSNAKVAALNSRLKDTRARLQDLPGRMSQFGSDLQSVGTWAAIAGGAMATFAIKSAMSLEEARNKFTALEGSVEKANLRIQRLLELSRKSVGVNFNDALDNFSQLQVLGTVGEGSIEKMIQALGRLRIAFDSSMGSSQDFLLNLQQLFSQGFEAQDWKQAIGRVPIFEQLVEKAFGTKDPAKLKQLRDAGKLTMDNWVAGLADAANNDTRLAGLSETFGIKLSKALTEINIAAAPFGQKMIDAIKPTLDDLISELQKTEPDLDGWSKRTGEKMGRSMGDGLIEGIKRLKDTVAEEFSKEEGSKGIMPFADGMREGFIKALQSKGLFPETPIFKDGFIAGLKRIYGPGIEVAQDIGKKVGQRMGAALRETVGPGMQAFAAALGRGLIAMGPNLLSISLSLGKNIVLGIVNGIRTGNSTIIGAVRDMANAAIAKAKSTLGIESPSKVFMKIGEDTVQGFIDGVTKLKTGAQKAMASLLDVSGLKGLTKKDAPGVELLSDLIRELDELTPRTKLEATMAELTAEKYKGLNAEVKKRIILAAEQLAIEEKRAALLEKFKNLEALPSFDPSVFNPDTEFNGQGTGSGEAPAETFEVPPPPPFKPWQDFWQSMQMGLERFRESLPSLKEVIGVNLINSIQGIGDVFANAVAQWDGTAKGFFQSLAQGFRQMIQQIIAELVRMMVMKAIMQLIGAFAGGIGGGGAAAAPSGILAGIGGMASGGQVRGPGSSSSDSIPAMLSNGEFVMSAKAVKQWGSGFFEQLNSGFSRPMAMAAGGAVGGSTYNNSSWSPTIVVNVAAGNTNASAVRTSAEQGAREALRMIQKQQMRSK